MRLIIIAGMPGAGKEEFLSATRRLGLPFLRMGDLVREFHSKRDPADGALSVGAFASAERDRHGFDIWAKRAMERMGGDVFVVDGCRSRDEVRAYQSLTDDVVVAIHSSPETRYERLVKRGRDDAPANPSEFEARDAREIGWGLAETIVLADVMLVNEGSLEEFWERSGEVAGALRG